MKVEILMIVGVLLLALYAWKTYKEYKQAESDKERNKLLMVYAGVIVLSIVIFGGVKIFDVAGKINALYTVEPDSSEVQEYEEEELDNLFPPTER